MLNNEYIEKEHTLGREQSGYRGWMVQGRTRRVAGFSPIVSSPAPEAGQSDFCQGVHDSGVADSPISEAG
jgi:hypothetical protein